MADKLNKGNQIHYDKRYGVVRDEKGRWAKGISGNPQGRKGRAETLQDIIGAHTNNLKDLVIMCVEKLNADNTSDAMIMKIVEYLTNYYEGKPVAKIADVTSHFEIDLSKPKQIEHDDEHDEQVITLEKV